MSFLYVLYFILGLSFNSTNCNAQDKYLKIDSLFVETIKEKINESFIITLKKEKEDLINLKIKDTNHIENIQNDILDRYEKENGSISNFQYYMDSVFNQLLNDKTTGLVEEIYLVSFRQDKGDYINIDNFIIINSYNGWKYYGLSKKRQEAFNNRNKKNSFGFNFEQFFLNLPYSFNNKKTIFFGGIHSLSIARIKATGENEYKIETRTTNELLPYQEIYLLYLLGFKKDLSMNYTLKYIN